MFAEEAPMRTTVLVLLVLAGVSVAALVVIPKTDRVLRAGIALYAVGCVVSYAVASPVGSNVTRLAPLIAGPLAALLWWRRRPLVLAALLVLLTAGAACLRWWNQHDT